MRDFLPYKEFSDEEGFIYLAGAESSVTNMKKLR